MTAQSVWNRFFIEWTQRKNDVTQKKDYSLIKSDYDYANFLLSSSYKFFEMKLKSCEIRRLLSQIIKWNL